MKTSPAFEGLGAFSLEAFLRVLSRRRWIATSIVLLAVVAGIVITLHSTRRYRATALVLIEQRAPNVLSGLNDVVDLGSSGYWATKEYYQTQYRVLQSRPVAARALEWLRVSPIDLATRIAALHQEAPEATPEALFEQLTPLEQKSLRTLFSELPKVSDQLIDDLKTRDFIGSFQKRIDVEPINESRLVKVSIVDTEPARAAQLANAVVEAYIAFNLDQRAEVIRSASAWLTEQIGTLKDRLEQSELKLHAFKRSNSILSASLESRQSIISQTLASLNEGLTEARTNRIELESKLREMDARSAKTGGPEASTLVITNRLIQDLKSEYARLAQEEAGLRRRYTDVHPALQTVRDKLERLTEEIAAEAQKIRASIERDFLAAKRTEEQIQTAIDLAKGEALNLSRKEIEFNRLRRERDNNESLYSLVLRRQKESNLTALLRANNVRRLETAQAPERPFRPRPAVNIVFSIFLGLVFGVAGALVMDNLDNSIKSPADIDELGLAFLGVLPAISHSNSANKDGDPSMRDLYIIENPKSHVAECCRTIRTNILFMATERRSQSLLVTSSGPREGKSTIAINLAIVMAQSGARTVLVDTDLRRPRLHKSLGLSSANGVSTVLLGEHTVENVVQRPYPGLDLFVLPCGPIPPNPAEMLLSEGFKNLSNQLLQTFDRVIFDSPPVGAVTDATIISSNTDGTVLVGLANKTPFPALNQVRQRLESVGASIYGVILNNVEPGSKGGGAGSYGYYHTYYHYDYGTQKV